MQDDERRGIHAADPTRDPRGALNVYEPEDIHDLALLRRVRPSAFKCIARSARLVKRPRRQEIVDERQRRLQPARQRRVVGGADERVQPDQPMAASLQPRDLVAQLARIAAIPAVGDEQHDRTAVQDAAAPALMELLARPRQSASLPTSPAPTATRPRARRPARGSAQLPRDARQLRGEQKRLDTLVAPRHGVREVQQHARVALHRAADVAEQHERARAHAPRPPRRASPRRRRCGGCRRSRVEDRRASRVREPTAVCGVRQGSRRDATARRALRRVRRS